MKLFELTFNQAHQKLDEVDTEMANALMQLERSLPQNIREGLTFASVKFHYTENIMENSKLSGQLETALEKYVLESGLPVGLILKGSLEIYRKRSTKKGRDVCSYRSCDVRLDKRALVGIFEALRYYLRDQTKVNADWDICSGVVTLYTLDDFTQAHQKKLKNKLKAEANNVPTVNELKTAIHIPEQMRISNENWIKGIEWCSEVLFLPRSLFDFIYDINNHIDFASVSQRNPEVINIRRLFSERAWPSAFQEINNFGDVLECFETMTAAEFCKSMLKVNRGDKILFSVGMEKHKGCPGSIISSEFLAAVEMKPDFLAPCYINEISQFGFIPLTHLLPEQIKNQKADFVESLIYQISHGLRGIGERNPQIKNEIIEVLGRITLKTGKGRNSKYYKISVGGSSLQTNGERLPLQNVESETFWKGVRPYEESKGEYVPNNMDFFSMCVRIDK